MKNLAVLLFVAISSSLPAQKAGYKIDTIQKGFVLDYNNGYWLNMFYFKGGPLILADLNRELWDMVDEDCNCNALAIRNGKGDEKDMPMFGYRSVSFYNVNNLMRKNILSVTASKQESFEAGEMPPQMSYFNVDLKHNKFLTLDNIVSDTERNCFLTLFDSARLSTVLMNRYYDTVPLSKEDTLRYLCSQTLIKGYHDKDTEITDYLNKYGVYAYWTEFAQLRFVVFEDRIRVFYTSYPSYYFEPYIDYSYAKYKSMFKKEFLELLE